MNLSSLVHTGRHQAEQHHHHQQQQQHFYAQERPQQQMMASSLVSNPYTAQPMAHNAQYAFVNAPQPPPSPPVDEATKCSLPSISSLLGMADGGSPQEQSQQQPQQTQQQAQQPQQAKQEYRPSSGHQQQYGPSPSLRNALPPTPPMMQSDSGFDARQQSPGAQSQYSVVSAPAGYYFAPGSVSAINNLEPHAQRQHVPAPPRRVNSMPANTMGYAQSPFNGSQYTVSPSQQSMSSYYSSPMQATPPQPQVSGLFYQRPLPQQFPPQMMPVSVTLTPSSGTNPWQHHHYISPSSAASFPQSQDRYICQTCNKAFSRPSSLRIHSHSHTGEKPFKCPHQGCGKAFSVRSNMKRHERGCHSYESSSGIL